MCLILRYNYWEVSGAETNFWSIYHKPQSHTLWYYFVQCPSLAEFRPQGQWDLTGLVRWLSHNVLLFTLKIIQSLPQMLTKCTVFSQTGYAFSYITFIYYCHSLPHEWNTSLSKMFLITEILHSKFILYTRYIKVSILYKHFCSLLYCKWNSINFL